MPVPASPSSTIDPVELAAELVRIPSVLGGERPVAERVAAAMRALRFDTVEIDATGNVVGTIAGDRPGPTVLFDAHMDTVDVRPEASWSVPPFAGLVRDGRLWGRGASDMKGALAAMVTGIGGLERAKLAGTIVLSGSVNEELIEGAALRAVMDRHPPDTVVIGEATGLDLAIAGRGRAELRISTLGVPAHASTPAAGVNAVTRMFDVCREIGQLPLPRDETVGDAVFCLTALISDPYPAHSVIPSACHATWERRLLPGETIEDLMTTLGAACERAGAADTEIRLAETDVTTWTGEVWREPKWYPAWRLDRELPVVEEALGALRSVALEPRLVAYGFCTNAAHSAGVAGVPTLGFGPGHEAHAHVVDEFVSTDELRRAAAGYRALATALGQAVPTGRGQLG